MSIIGKKLHSLLNTPIKRKDHSNTVPFELASSIGVLYTWTDQRSHSEIQNFITELSAIKEVMTLCFNPLKEPISVLDPVVHISELSNLGKLNSAAASKFMRTPLDYLFHLDFTLNEITQSILAKSKAKCRIGIHSEQGQDYYEMMIGINKNAGFSNFAGQMLKYAKEIK